MQAHDQAYDYVIVGAGSAGCVLAARLSADPAARVLVLEAGGSDDRPQIREPALWAANLGGDVDWGYLTEPQAHAHGRRIPWPRGKVLGGSSSINTMVHMRGARADYDGWAARFGAVGWDYDSVLPAFRALEDYPGGDPRLRGTGGPLMVRLPVEPNAHSRAAHEAAVELGHPVNHDFNGAALEGVGWNQLTIAGGRRQSAYTAFLEPVLNRANLTVLTGALVRRVVLSGSTVTGIEYEREGAVHTAGVDREAILCAGAVESPKLLLLSGIGPAGDLRALGIDVVLDVGGVGRNLHDHPGIPVTWTARTPMPPGRNQGSEAGLFTRSDPALAEPDLQFGMLNVAILPDGSIDPAGAFSFYPSLLKPDSRGRLRLRSADPADPPLIDPRYLAAASDVDRLVRAVEISRELAYTEAMRAWTGDPIAPGRSRDAAELRDYVRAQANTWFHPVGTCRLGTDELAVVGPDLAVHGAAGLRVADASVIPEITSGNTNAPALMIGWRAADLIAKG